MTKFIIAFRIVHFWTCCQILLKMFTVVDTLETVILVFFSLTILEMAEVLAFVLHIFLEIVEAFHKVVAFWRAKKENRFKE